jgi:hypothetical protein
VPDPVAERFRIGIPQAGVVVQAEKAGPGGDPWTQASPPRYHRSPTAPPPQTTAAGGGTARTCAPSPAPTGDYLLGKVSKVFPQLRSDVLG